MGHRPQCPFSRSATCTRVHPCQGYATNGVVCYLNYGLVNDNVAYLVNATGMRLYDKVARY